MEKERAKQQKGGGVGGTHERGLSLFQDDALVETIVNNGGGDDGLRGLSIE